jgi:hypothetical protein
VDFEEIALRVLIGMLLVFVGCILAAVAIALLKAVLGGFV